MAHELQRIDVRQIPKCESFPPLTDEQLEHMWPQDSDSSSEDEYVFEDSSSSSSESSGDESDYEMMRGPSGVFSVRT